ncbi:MAG: phage tail protein [Bacilli bacterium]|nr:phage tail protein [Bacilli bacterium]
MVDLIYLFNREDTLLEILSKNDFDNFNCKKQLNGSMEMSFITKSKSNIKRFNKVGVFIDDEFQLFYIDDFNDFKSLEENEIETICLADFYNLSNTIIEDKRIINGPINTAITKALEGTDYKVGVVETFENKDINFYFINSLEALNKIISTYNCEFNARYILNEDNTISKFIDLRHRLGIDTGLRFTYDTVLENVEKSPINEGLFNVLYGRGKSLETEDGGFSRKLDFAEVNNGKKYVEDLDSIKKYGRLEGIYENSNIEDKNILLEKTKERLEEVKYQKFNYKATVKDITKILGLEHFKVELGDSIIILDEEINDIVEARIIEIDINSDEVFLTLGHYQKGLIDEDLENKFDNIKDSLDKIENEKIDDSKYPNTLPSVPVLEGKGLFATVDLSWTFENKSYYTYEVYASKQKDFNPSIFNRIFEGKASSLLHEVKPSQTWYYRCRAKNTHGNYTDFSNQVEAHTLKLSDAAEYFEEAAIGHALIKDLDADKITVGTLKGNRIDARNINVTDGNGKKTLAIDSFGNVTLLPTNFKILVEGKEESVISQSSFNIALDKINLSIKTVEEKTTETNKSLIELGYTMNGAFKDGIISEAETKAINERLVQLDKEKTDLDVQYNAIITNSNLQGTAKINISNAKNDFNSKYTDLKSYIISAISDKKVTDVEKTNINTKTNSYNTALANLQKSFNEALDSISKIKADNAQTNANNHTDSEINKVVTNTNSKFSEIKATTDAISSKVEKVEETTTKINGQILEHNERIQTAEEKITPDAITETVTNSQKYKDDFGNVYTIEESNSKIEQKANEIKTSINGISPGNLIKNGDFEINLDDWSKNNKPTLHHSDGGVDGGKCLGIEVEAGLGHGVYQYFNTIPGETYSISCYCYLIFGDAYVTISDTHYIHFTNDMLNKWHRVTLTFTATSNSHFFAFYTNSNARTLAYIDKVMVNKGSIALDYTDKSPSQSYIEQQLTPSSLITKVQESLNNGENIESASMIFDKSGLRVESISSNTKTNMTSDGFKIIRNSDNKVLFEARDGKLYIDGDFKSDYTIHANGGIYTGQAIRGTGDNFTAVASNGNAILRSDKGNCYLQTVDEVKITGPADPNTYRNLRAHNVIANNKVYSGGNPVGYIFEESVIPILANANVRKESDGTMNTSYYIHQFLNENSEIENGVDIGTQIALLVKAFQEQQIEIENLKAKLNV